MSGINTKDSKVNRIRATQLEHSKDFDNLFALGRLNHETDTKVIARLTAENKLLAETVLRQQNTIDLLSKTTHRQDAEIVSLRRQLGLALAKLNKPSAFDRTFPFLSIPTLEPHWGNRNLPHTGTETV